MIIMWDCDCAASMGRVWPVRLGSTEVGIMRVLGGGVSTVLGEARKLQSRKVPQTVPRIAGEHTLAIPHPHHPLTSQTSQTSQTTQITP